MRNLARLIGGIVVLMASCAIASPPRFIRVSGQLLLPTGSLYYCYEDSGISIRKTDGAIKINWSEHLGAREDDYDDWANFTFTESLSGKCQMDAGSHDEFNAKARDFDAILEFSPRLREVFRRMFARIGQPELTCSARFIRLRDGLEAWEPDGETAVACQFYVGLLDNEDWRVRSEASERLAELGETGALWLMKEVFPRSAEQQCRIACILAKYPTWIY